MANTAATLLVGIAPEDEAKILTGLEHVTVARAAPELSALAEALGRHQPRTAIIGVPESKGSELAMRLIAQASQGGVRVIAYGGSKDAELILRAMRAGAQDFAVPGEERSIAQAIESSATSVARAPAGRVTTVFPAKGGAGATALATHLAAALASRGERVCLVDLDPSYGGVLSALEVKGGYAIAEVLANMHRLDRELLDTSLARHSSGAYVLGHGERVEDAERVGPKDVANLVDFLERHYDQLILDGVRGFGEHALVALDASDLVLLLVTQEVPAARNAQRTVELFRRLGYPDEKIRPVVNRFHKSWKIDAAILGETIGVPVAATLSNDYAGLSGAIDRGVLVSEHAPRSAFNQDLQQLANTLRVAGPSAEAGAQRSFLSRLLWR
ncbi:MAG TPA: pilus assembly protein CpaE [Myxococcales bacterium]|nr:pilus assembly protein CpaE [Myxococcales bacterium]